jgi:hypothetical protein
VVLLGALALGRAEAASFQDALGRRGPLAPVGQAFADWIGSVYPVTGASAGVTFTFDKETHAFERETDVFGQLFLERPRPLGRGRWNLAFSYQHVEIDEIQGRDLGELRDPGPPIADPDTGVLFRLPRFSLSLRTHQLTAGATYGVSDDLDVNLALPILVSTFEIDAVKVVLGAPTPEIDHRRITQAGVGDLRLRAKQRLGRGRFGELAAGLGLRFPTGSEDDFQGTGAFQVAPSLYAASPPARLGDRVRLEGFANAGLDLVPAHAGRSAGTFGVGLDVVLADRCTLAAALLAREPFAGIADPGRFDVERIDASGRRHRSAVLGLSSDRARLHHLSLGGRVELYADTIFAFANVLVPLGHRGFRTSVIPLLGIEAAF